MPWFSPLAIIASPTVNSTAIGGGGSRTVTGTIRVGSGASADCGMRGSVTLKGSAEDGTVAKGTGRVGSGDMSLDIAAPAPVRTTDLAIAPAASRVPISRAVSLVLINPVVSRAVNPVLRAVSQVVNPVPRAVSRVSNRVPRAVSRVAKLPRKRLHTGVRDSTISNNSGAGTEEFLKGEETVHPFAGGQV